MDNFSDDERFEVDQIIGQRKRKGILEYLVQWKGTGKSGNTWEPAKTIAADCAQAVQSFIQSQKEQKSLSKSKTRSTSRSRSRSSSRSRKAAAETKAGKSSRSRSRGRSDKKKSVPTTPVEQKTEDIQVRRSQRQKAANDFSVTEVTEIKETKVISEQTSESQATTSSSLKSVETTMSSSSSKTTTEEEEVPARSLRSSTLEQRQKLEVQRVHNDQRPVREDDSKPRSPIWKVADYIVIVMFVVSVFAAIFLFLEKFVDLENFKKQAFPNFGVLKDRLSGALQGITGLCQNLWGHVTDGWLYLLEQIKRPETVAKSKAAAA